MVKKIAVSSDPKQQQLRDLKKLFNQEMKTFIAQDIALKRGINGRGDEMAGLPPSDIKDPLPPEIYQYLQETDARFERVKNLAKRIIRVQEEYSRTRRKGRKEMGQTGSIPIATAAQGITKEASNRWTRIFAKWTQMPWFRDDKATRARLRMLSSLSELKDQVNEIEYVLASQDKRAVTHAFFAWVRFLAVFRHRFIKKVMEELTRQRNEVVGIPPTKEDKNFSAPVPLPDKPINPSRAYEDMDQQKQYNQTASKEENEAGAANAKASSNIPPDALDQVKDIQKDIQFVGALLVLIDKGIEQNKIPGPKPDANKVHQVRQTIQRMVNEIGADPQTVDKHYNDLQNMYTSFVEALSRPTGIQPKPLAQLVDDLTKSVNTSDATNAALKYEAIEKFAKKKFERWMRRMMLWMYSDEFSKSKLDTVNKLRDLSKEMNAVLDFLEKKDAKMGEILHTLAELFLSIGRISWDFAHFANLHNADYGEVRARGDKSEIGPINRGDITFVRDEILRLKRDADALTGQGEGKNLGSITGEKLGQ